MKDAIVLLAAEELEFDLIHHITDHPWFTVNLPVVGRVTWMSSGIAAMILVAIIILAIVLPLARRYQRVPKGGRNVIEVLVVFVRDMIAKPALHEQAYPWLSYLTTMFVFILFMNLLGLIPLQQISNILAGAMGLQSPGSPRWDVGGTPTSIMTVCGGLALVTFATIVVKALGRYTQKLHEKHHVPVVLSAVLSPLMWIKGFAPKIPGVAGVLLVVPLTLLEFIGVFAKCFALMIRLFANMISGHTLLAVLMMLALQSAASFLRQHTMHALYVDPITILSSVIMDIMELLVAVIQAYVFTFLTAMFLALYIEPEHSH